MGPPHFIMTTQHTIELDYAGMGAHARLTCWSHEDPIPPTLVRQPFMDDERWLKEATAFVKEHPTGKFLKETRRPIDAVVTPQSCEHVSGTIKGIQVQYFHTDDGARMRSGARKGQAWT